MYHNLSHTYEVVQMTTYLLGCVPEDELTPVDRTILQVAALCHDYGHTGISNKDWDDESICKLTHRVSSTESVNRINSIEMYQSYNESMHIEMTMDVIIKYHKQLFGKMSLDAIRHHIETLILSTDISAHNDYMVNYIAKNTKMSVMILILKLADISHILRPFHVHLYWVYKLKQECRHCRHCRHCHDIGYVSQDTIKFANAFVKPLMNVFVMKYPKANDLEGQMNDNLEQWSEYS